MKFHSFCSLRRWLKTQLRIEFVGTGLSRQDSHRIAMRFREKKAIVDFGARASVFFLKQLGKPPNMRANHSRC